MENTYEKAYVEILEILKYIPILEYNKIPKERIEFFEKNKDKNYQYKYDVKNPVTLKKTDAIIVDLYNKYFANETEKEKIKEILKLNEQVMEINKKEKYPSNNIFENKNIMKENNALQQVEKKEKWYVKLFRKIKFVLFR